MGTSEPSEPVAKLNKESNASQGHIAESLNESGYDVREDQVQNAVAFLSHPKVRGSADSSKRNFLERKGLTSAEIEEAFRRVPSVSNVSPFSESEGTASALQNTVQHIQPAMSNHLDTQQGKQSMTIAQHQPVRWSQVALGAGFFAAGAYAVKQLLWPYVWDAYATWKEQHGGTLARTRSQSQVEPAIENHSLKAVAEAIQAQTAELRRSIEAIHEISAALETQRKKQEEDNESAAAQTEPTVTMVELRQELKSLASSLQESFPQAAAVSSGVNVNPAAVEHELAEMRKILSTLLPGAHGADGAPKGDVENLSARPCQLDAKNTELEHYLTDQSAAKQASGSSRDESSLFQEGNNRIENQVPRPDSATSLASSSPSQPQHPTSYMEVLDMLQKGMTPPGIRTDINDTPPDPAQPLAQPRMKPRAKPWERQQKESATVSSWQDGLPSGLRSSQQSFVDSFQGSPPMNGLMEQEHATGKLSEQEEILPEQISEPVSAETGSRNRPSGSHGGVFQSPPRTANSIYEAASTSVSPGIIMDRFSPMGTFSDPTSSKAMLQSLANQASTPSKDPERYPVHHHAEFIPDREAGGKQARTETNIGETERMVESVGAFGGSGIARPLSSGWRPPPIPVPTFLSGRSDNKASSASLGSLGEDFSSSV